MAKRIHSQTNPQPHRPSSFNRLILFPGQVLGLCFSNVFFYFFLFFTYLIFKRLSGLFVSFLRDIFLELLFTNQPDCPFIIIILHNTIYFLYTTDYNLYSFISFSLPYWTMNSLKAGIMCVFYFSLKAQCTKFVHRKGRGVSSAQLAPSLVRDPSGDVWLPV